MVSLINYVFNSNDLPGQPLISPIKSYQNFFTQKISDSSGLGKLCWIISNLASAIFAYPTFGTLSLIGTAVSICGIPSLRAHNGQQLDNLNSRLMFASLGKTTWVSASSATDDKASVLKIEKNFKVTKLTYDRQIAEIKYEAAECSDKMKKIFFQVNGNAEKGEAEVLMKVRVPKEA